MRTRFHSDRRSAAALHIEPLEERWLLFGVTPLLVPPVVMPSTVLTWELAPPIAFSVPGIGLTLQTEAAITAASACGDASLNPAGVVSIFTVVTRSASAGVDLQRDAAGGGKFDIGLGRIVVRRASNLLSESVMESLGAAASPGSSTVAVAGRAHLPMHGTAGLGSAGLAVDSGPDLGSNGRNSTGDQKSRGDGLGHNSSSYRSDGGDDSRAGVQEPRLPTNADSRHGGTEVSLAGPETATSTSASSGVSTPDGDADTATPSRLGSGPEQVVLREPGRFEVTPEALREDSSLATFRPAQANLLMRTVTDRVEEALTVRPSRTDPQAVLVHVASAREGSRGDENSILPSPYGDKQLVHLLPFNFASLEEEIQAFLQQVEQFGRELHRLIGPIDLSIWLMAIAAVAVAGEVVRRRFQNAQHEAFFAASASTAWAWFPGLTGPWYLEEL